MGKLQGKQTKICLDKNNMICLTYQGSTYYKALKVMTVRLAQNYITRLISGTVQKKIHYMTEEASQIVRERNNHSINHVAYPHKNNI